MKSTEEIVADKIIKLVNKLQEIDVQPDNDGFLSSDAVEIITATLTARETEFQTEKEYMLREFENVKKLREDEHQKEKEKIQKETVSVIKSYLDRLDGENRLFGYQTAIRDVKAFIREIATNHNIHYE